MTKAAKKRNKTKRSWAKMTTDRGEGEKEGKTETANKLRTRNAKKQKAKTKKMTTKNKKAENKR